MKIDWARAEAITQRCYAVLMGIAMVTIGVAGIKYALSDEFII